ncbi:TadA family conjugal transfer-associated ATPase [Schaalia georgiae]|uniref:TadA family conjugal transfer-associated ATPase n=1 Tax=Schaalia georgiae TaxID=52768 RepID=UPI0009DBA09E|nr:TadA family conjugal transfer-associated ATPase [Schaalia georgiae]
MWPLGERRARRRADGVGGAGGARNAAGVRSSGGTRTAEDVRRAGDERSPEGPGPESALRALAAGEDLPESVSRGVRPGAGSDEIARCLAGLRATSGGLGPALAPLVADPRVTDVLVNGTQVWVDRGKGLVRAGADVGGGDDVRRLAIRMAAACGKRLDDASPIVDGTLEGGVRLHAVLAPVSASGTLISLRAARGRNLSVDALARCGTLAPRVASLLRALVRARANVLISGQTGSGKTTLLAAVLALVPPDERIVCIEETTELRPDHPHCVNLAERRPNVEGAGGVTLAELVRAAMRMRPDRLVLGECRGGEVRDVLTALNTGHDGGWATVHANGVRDVPARLLALGSLAGMGESAVAAQTVAAFDAFVHLRRHSGAAPGSPGRWVSEVGVPVRNGSGLHADLALAVDQGGGVEEGPAWPLLAQRCRVPS